MDPEPRAVLLDIEGTTTPIDFVTKTLFPFARQEMAAFLQRTAREPQTAADLRLLSEEYQRDLDEGNGPPPWPARPSPEHATSYLHWLMDRDRKSTGLKSVQGRIWESGFHEGRLLGEVYPDVEPALRRWKSQGRAIYIYSSGSVLAQRLLFAHLPGGPLTALIDGYFDTNVGPKRSPDSYQAIAMKIGLPPSRILFLSDVHEEIQAAHQAGCRALQVHRPPAAPPTPDAISTFDQVA